MSSLKLKTAFRYREWGERRNVSVNSAQKECQFVTEDHAGEMARIEPNVPIAVATYLALLSVALITATLAVPWGSDAGKAIGGLAVMWTPATAAILASVACRYPIRSFGWRPGNPRFLLLGYLLPAAYALGPFAIDALIEHGRFTASFWATYPEHFGLARSVWLGPIMLATIEPLFGMIAATGEEIGWRGFLFTALFDKLGFWRAVWLSWGAWFAFHLPAMLGGDYHGVGTPLWFSLVCFAAMLFAATVILSSLRLASGSIWPCAIAHAVHNLYIQEVAPSAFSGGPLAPWLEGEFGLLTVMATMVAAVFCVRWLRGPPASERVNL